MQTIPLQPPTSDRPESITILDHSRGLVVRVRTNLTVRNSADLQKDVLSAWEAKGKPPRIVVDLAGVQQIDSAGTAALMTLAQKANDTKVPFILCGLDEAHLRTFQRTGLARLFRTSESVEEGLLGVSVQGAEEPVKEPVPPKSPVVAPVYPLTVPDVDRSAGHSHLQLWTVVGFIIGALLAVALWAWWALGTYRGTLNLIPALHDELAGAGKRLDAAEAAVKDWNAQREAWGLRLSAVEGRVNGVVATAREQAEAVSARGEKRMEAKLDRRTGSLASRLDAVQSAQHSTDARVADLQAQLQRAQATNQQELSRLRQELGRQSDSNKTGLAQLDQRVAALDQQTGESGRQLQAVRDKLARNRLDFEIGVNQNREIAPGVTMDVSRTDVLRQRYDGHIFLMPDRRTVWVKSQGLQKPLVFYTQADERPRELIITRVTKNSVIGYLLLPPDPQNPTAPGRGAQ